MFNAQIISASLLSANPSLTGSGWALTTQALGLGVFNWITSSVTCTATCTGVLGVGVATGKIIIPPNIILVTTAFTTNGMVGNNIPAIAQAITFGIAQVPFAFSGPSPIVGVGACVIANILAPYPALLLALKSSFTALGLTPNELLLNSYALGISSLISLSSGVGAVAGSPSIVPSSGIAICKFI